MDDVLPTTIYNDERDTLTFRLFVANSGSQRFDVVSVNLQMLSVLRLNLVDVPYP